MARTHARALTAAVLLTALCLRAPRALAQDALSKYAIDWATVPATAGEGRSVTGSCTCKAFIGACTPNCCCDPECPASVVGQFRSEGSCLPEGPPPDQLQYCAAAEQVAKVNLPSGTSYSLQQVAAGGGFVGQLLCIQSDSNPSLGSVYSDPAIGDVGDNKKVAQCPAPTAAAAPSQPHYAYKDAVLLAATGGGSTLQQPMTIPTAALSAQCSDAPLAFMQRVPASSKDQAARCQRPIADAAALAALCNSAASFLAPASYLAPKFLPEPSASAGVAFTRGSVQQRSGADGALAAVTGTLPAAAYDVGAGVCRNAVWEVAYTLVYALQADAARGALAQVVVNLVLADLPAASLPFSQAFSAGWRNSSAASSAPLPLSGNPGYLPGRPLLAGLSSSDSGATRTAVARYVGGLPLPLAAPGGGCSAATHAAVAFGTNASSSCAVALDRAALQAFCTGGNAAQHVQAALGGLFQELADGKVLVGAWGNSNMSLAEEWVQVVVSGLPAAAAAPSWDAQQGVCSNVVTGFDLQLATGLAGSASSPQAKVLYASLCFRYGNWRSVNGAAPAAKQKFFLGFGVHFVAKQQATAGALKPAPPLFAPLPADVLFPFTSGAGQHRPGRPGLLAPAVAALLAGLWVLLS